MKEENLVEFQIFFQSTELLVTFGITLLGLLFGRLQIKGVGFASSGTLVVAMMGGYFFQFEPIPILQDLGIVLFLLCVGLEAGPGFFRAFKKHGRSFVTNVLALLAFAGVFTVILLWVSGVDSGIGLGLFAGSFTSSPALISAMQFNPERDVIFGYGVGYPFGLLGVIVFINVAMKFLRPRMDRELAGQSKIFTAVHRLENEQMDGKLLKNLDVFHDNRVVITGILRDGTLMAASGKTNLVLGDLLRLEGSEEDVQNVGEQVGATVDQEIALDGELSTSSIVVENMNVINRTLKELGIRLRFNASIAKIVRSEIEMFPSQDLRLEYGDVVHAVGSPYQLEQLKMFLGSEAHAVIPRVDIASMAATLFLAFFIGGIIIPIPGMGPFSLGLAGGALVSGLLFGHFGRIGNFIGRFPPNATAVLKDLGLALFFVQVGFDTGQSFINNLGPEVMIYALFAVLLAVIPMAASLAFGHLVMKISISECFGVICGGMTFTPGLDVIRQVDSSEKPVVAYSAVYPVSLILVIALVQGMHLALAALR
ncbi:MAG TPA: hypothetical protein DEA96_08235 [Leptospiraceae bacterium]|nr:hypothetical protein [Spirochaetaceae bacterium]HBS04937.1 hypothetical protein [Leptospiraceae bacterium]|tara:strand:+ start:42342 stop:43955 length:1614 start_codon:yes stop_codon:yes gene_type:complete